MPILNLQREMTKLGEIRTGTSTPGRGGAKVPRRLDTFRLTSQSQELVFAAAAEYGGTPAIWSEGGWEVVTATDSLDIVVPPGQMVSQWWELWAGRVCSRRCNGETEVISMSPCLCPQAVAERVALAGDGKACRAVTRLKVILPRIPGLGTWLLTSHGYYAAVELAGAADVLAAAAGQGRLIPARLRLDKRERVLEGQPAHKYTVPVIDVLAPMGDVPALEGGWMAPPALPPGTVRVPALPSTTLPETSDLRPPVPLDITREQLLGAIDALGIPREYALRLAAEMFGEGQSLTGTERGQLLERLRRGVEPEP